MQQQKKKTVANLFRFGYIAMALSICVGSVISFVLYLLTEALDPGIHSVFSFFGCCFASELRTLFQYGSTNFFDYLIVTIFSLLALSEAALLAFINIRALKNRKREPSYFNLALFGIDALMYLFSVFSTSGHTAILIVCVLYRILTIGTQCISAALDTKYT